MQHLFNSKSEVCFLLYLFIVLEDVIDRVDHRIKHKVGSWLDFFLITRAILSCADQHSNQAGSLCSTDIVTYILTKRRKKDKPRKC